MNNIPETINNVLEVLSTKFGTSVDHLWQVMVQQQIYEGKAHLVIGIIFGIISIVGIIALIRWSFSNNYNEDACIGSFLISFVAIMFMMAFFYLSYMELVNPEYQAIKEFLEVFKGE